MARALTTHEKLISFITEFCREAKGPGKIYLVGGACAVLHGWRASTIDIDLKAEPEPGRFYETLQLLKETLDLNVELASPDLFVPPLPEWQQRSPWILSKNGIDFHHFDFYSQALAKLARSHPRDLIDIKGMLQDGLLQKTILRGLFDQIRPQLIRYPKLDPQALELQVYNFCNS
jgi:hypothetical protein